MKKMYKILTLLSVVVLAANGAFAQRTFLFPAGATTFNYTGSTVPITIPIGVDSIWIKLSGAGGGRNGDSATHVNFAGTGACDAQAIYSVTPSMSIYINVGGRGHSGVTTASFNTPGGFNGGGQGKFLTGSVSGGGGGGASDVRFNTTALSDRVIVAGGGGGAGTACGGGNESGGNAGGTPTFLGVAGVGGCPTLGSPAAGGGGGTLSTGGTHGTCTTCSGGVPADGALGVGGDAGGATPGGGGGGGYYGGGGGKYTGGGGGSSYYAPFAISPSTFSACSTGDGVVAIAYHCIPQTITATRTTICPYETLTLSDNVGGGTWSSSNPSVGSVGSISGVVTGITPGSSTVQTILLTYTAGPCTATQTITINPLPPAITGSTTICSGLTSNLTDPLAGGTWTSTGAASVDAFGVISGSTAGTGTVTYANPTTGCYITAPTLINPLPANITGTFQVCVGLTQALTDVTPLGTWTSGSTTIADIDINTGVVTGNFAGSGSDLITYTITSTGCIKTHAFTVNPLPDPVTGSLLVCEGGGTTTLTNFTPFGPGTWSTGSGHFSVNATTGVVTGISAGTGTVTFTITSTGCLTTGVVTVNPLPTLYAIAPATVTHYCHGTTGVDVTLANSQSGFQYDLYNGSTYVSTLTGTGGLLDFGVQLAGSYTIKAIDITLPTNCAVTMTGTATIIEDPLPKAITGASGVCAGSTTTLSDADLFGKWTSSNTNVATVGSNSGVVTGVALSKGTATITYTLPSGCFITTPFTVNPNYPIYGIKVGCLGDILNVADSSDLPGGGVWTGSGGITVVVGTTGDVATVNRGSAGTGTVTYTSPFGCKAFATVTFNPLTSIAGPTTVCEGSIITLSNANPGGIWSSHNTLIATVDAFGNVLGVSATVGGGTVQIDYSLSTGCVAGLVITVNPTPSAIIGSSKICQGLSTTLSDALPGGVWSAACTSLLTIGSGTGLVTTTASGTCTISYTMPVTGCMATMSYTINPQPTTIVGTLNLCIGFNGGLSDGISGGTWTSLNTTVVTVDLNLGTLVSVSPGTSIIVYTLPTGCFTTAVVTVYATPPPITFVTGTDTLCGGSTITLTDALVPAGTWSTKSGGVISSAVLPPGTILGGGGTGGLDSVIYTSTVGCKVAKYIYVRTLSPIGGPTKMCVGSTFTFTELATGGTWSSSNTIVATVNSSGLVTALSPGVTTIMDTFSTGCYATKTVTVYPNPSPITGATFTVCAGSTITLSDPSLGGTWTSAPTTVATIGVGTGIVTGVDPLGGTATITYTISVSGCTATAIVTVNPLDTIIGPSSICQDDNATMSDATVGGGTWSTSNTNIAIIGSTSGIISKGTIIPPGGVVTVIFTTSLGCTATKTFTVNPIGNITPDRVCVGSTVTLTDNIGTGTWSTTSTAIALIGSSGVVTGSTAGTSVVTYTIASTGCKQYILFITDPLPAPISGNLVVCQGYTTGLSDADAFGTWSSSITTVGTISSSTGTAGGISGGTSTITYKLSLTGCQTTAVLTVNPTAPITGTRGVCVGQTTTLSDALGGGTWSNSCTLIMVAGTSTGNVTGVTNGTCTITYTNLDGCASMATVTVFPLPSTIQGATFAVCQGKSIVLTDAVGGGTWSSSATIITVTPVGVSSTGTVTGNSAGTATVTYTSGLGCYTTTVVTVNPMTAIITAPFQVCMGSTITLSDLTLGGTWSRGLTTININSTGVVTTNSVGTSVVTYSISSTGCSATAIVTVNPLPNAINGPSVVCAGSSIVLTDATAGGNWLATPVGNVTLVSAGASTTVTGVSGSATITYSLPTTCYVTHTVTVNPVPGPITGVKILCAGIGNSTQLSDATAFGTWSSVNTVVGTVGSTSGLVVSKGVVGTTTISYTLNSTGCAATAVVTVSPFPDPITGPTVVCARSTITLSDALTPGTWSSLNSAIATITTPGGVVLGRSAGTATIDYVSPAGCNATYVVTVNPQPTALITPLGSTTLCPGLFVALTANTGTKLTYQWYDATTGTAIIAGETNASYIAMPPVNTTYEVAVTDSFGCSDTSATVLVSILTATATITAFPSSGIVCAGTAISLTASGTAPTGYQWELGGVPIPGATSVSYAPTVSGSYDAVVSNASGCNAVSSPITVTINPKPSGTITAVGSTVFCAGDSVELKADTGTGYTYQWYNSAGSIPGYTNRTYFFKTAETYHVVVTNSTGCTITSGTIGVTVKPLPTGAALSILLPGSLEFCTGSSVNLIASSDVLPLANFLWYQNGIPIGLTGASLVVSTTGRYKALVTDPATGCSVFTPEDTTKLVTAPVIVPISSASFCWGGSAALRAGIVSGITPTYQWYVGGVPIAGATDNIYSAISGGNYTVKITSACSITSLPVSVKENPLPNPLLKFDGEHIYATYNAYVSYQWYKDLVSIPGATHYNVVPSTNGKYKVSVIDTNGCQSMSTEYILTGWTAHFNGVQTPLAQGEIRVFPNPAQDMLHIESADVLKAVITSIDGRVLIQQPNAKDIDIKSLIDGIYTITLYDVNGQMVKADKFVKTTE